MSMSRKKCCVPGCYDSGSSHRTMHLFPNPAKDLERFNKWVLSIGGDIIGLDNEDIYKHRSVCHSHFEEKFCCRFDRLSNIAVPTLNLPGLSSIPKFTFVERRPMRQLQNFQTNTASTISMPSTTLSSPIASTSVSLAGLQMHSLETVGQVKNDSTLTLSSPIASTSASLAGLQMHSLETVGEVKNDSTLTENLDPVVTLPLSARKIAVDFNKEFQKRKVIKKHIIATPGEQKLHQKLLKIRIKLSKCRNKIKRQAANLQAAKKMTSNPALLSAMEKLSSTSKILTLLQFRESKKQNKGRRFLLQEKILALSIFKLSPKAYRFLRRILILPAPQTLAKLISEASIDPGINNKIFSQLKSAAEKMKPEHKLCILLFDEMFLKANLSYNEKKDMAVGFVTDGITTKSDYADHAQVFMIRGIMKNYKQPICYTFAASATSGQEIATYIKQLISQLQSAGFVVVATVCDQGSNNKNAIKLLLQETRGSYLRKGQEPKNNVFVVNDQEVVPLYDPPHLLKCVRNNLLTKNLEYYENDTKRIAKWEHLLLLYKENPGYKGIRLIPKLTENHVMPEKVSKHKMKVKFATQIFSRTVATNMGYLADKGILPKECNETADILIFFDNLFDSLNGSANKNKFAKTLLGPVTPKSQHHNVWQDAKKKLKKMKFINVNSGKYENVPTLDNWAWTLEGIEVLLKNLEFNYKISSLWMRHLNQDPIENFFGAIRSHGCRNTNPTPDKFVSAFTTLLINNLSSVHGVGSNCEEDYGKNLHALIVTNDCEASTSCSIELVENIVIEDLKSKSDPRIMGALQYVCGYFIRKAKIKIFKNCATCKSNTIALEGAEYIKYREYAGRQWLCSPNENIINCISAVQDITYAIIKQSIEKKHIKELIKTYVLMLIDFNFLECNEHKEKIVTFLINITSRFFLYNYCKDINKILNGKMDCYDDEDRLQIKAKKYFKKCSKRPKK